MMFKHTKHDISGCEVSFEFELSLYLKLSFKIVIPYNCAISIMQTLAYCTCGTASNNMKRPKTLKSEKKNHQTDNMQPKKRLISWFRLQFCINILQ